MQQSRLLLHRHQAYSNFCAVSLLDKLQRVLQAVHLTVREAIRGGLVERRPGKQNKASRLCERLMDASQDAA